METNPLSLSRTSTVELTACQLFRKKSSSILQDARRPCLIGILRSLDVALALIWSSIQHYPRSLHTHACVQLDALLIFFFTRFTCMYAYQKLTRRALLVLVTYLLTAASLVAEGPSFYSTRKGSSAVEHWRRSSESSRYRRVERAEKKGGHHLTLRVFVNADTHCACRILLLVTCSPSSHATAHPFFTRHEPEL